jgi:uncharacterized protein YmfQ (DUF2313 family)
MKAYYLILTATLVAPAPLLAADSAKKTDMDRSRYSDRDMRKGYEDEEKKLEQTLKTGQDKNFYRRELEKMGYQITSVNYDKPDYVEYEIVKGNNTYEAQIDFDKNSGKATKIDIAANLWRTDATKAALRGKKAESPKGTVANPDRYSDRDRRKAYDSEEEKLEKTLKTGENKQYYRSQLEKMGYKVTSVNADRPDYVEYEIVKGNDTYEVQIDFDKNSNKGTKVDVTTNLWQAEATDKALSQRQEKTRDRSDKAETRPEKR